MSAVGIATSGLQASLGRLHASAANTASAGSVGSLAASAAAETGRAGADAAYQPVRAVTSDRADGGVSLTYARVAPSYGTGYDPSSPVADAEGRIAVPNVDQTDEAVERLLAKSAAESNIAVLCTACDMQGTLFDLRA